MHLVVYDVGPDHAHGVVYSLGPTTHMGVFSMGPNHAHELDAIKEPNHLSHNGYLASLLRCARYYRFN